MYLLCNIHSDNLDPKDYIVGKLSRKLAENDKRGKDWNMHFTTHGDINFCRIQFQQISGYDGYCAFMQYYSITQCLHLSSSKIKSILIQGNITSSTEVSFILRCLFVSCMVDDFMDHLKTYACMVSFTFCSSNAGRQAG